MRIVIAGLLGGVVFFIWGAVAHMMLPLGEMGVKQPTSEDAVIAGVRDNLPGEGVYMVPGLTSTQMQDEAAVAAYSQKAKTNPYAFIVYQPQGKDGMDMGMNLATQFVSGTLASLALAFVLALGAFGFGKRVFISGLMGLSAWLAISVPYANWYRFPMDFTVANLIEQVLGWVLAGLAIAAWLGRKDR